LSACWAIAIGAAIAVAVAANPRLRREIIDHSLVRSHHGQ
jgi:hypothetical protein